MANEKNNLNSVKNSQNFQIDYSSVKELREIEIEDVSKGQTKLHTFNDYKRIKKRFNPSEPIVESIPRPFFGADLRHFRKFSSRIYPKGKMMIVVNYDLYPDIKSSIDQYVYDLADEGYYTYVYRYKGGSAGQLRQFIIKHRSRFTKGEVVGNSKRARLRLRRDPIGGVVFVGNLPVAWYEHTYPIWHQNEQKYIEETSVFPCDLFFMDTNGVWTDFAGDGDYNTHTEDVDAEIWVGRIWSPDMGGNNANLIRQYFSRNHLFRKGRLGHSNKGLTIVDDDWTNFGKCAMDRMLPSNNIEAYTDKIETNANTYKAKMAKRLGWAQICAHSNPYLHSFTIPDTPFKEENNIIKVGYIRDENPPQANFYNLFACSNALFTRPDYMAGWYIFDKPGNGINPGMAAIGSTKTGSMLFFENFYEPMGRGKTIGEAFVEWWKCLGSIHDTHEIYWFYGLTLLGDPTLNWWNGAVPVPVKPFDHQVFSHYPRETRYEWKPVMVEGVPVEYHVEVDAYHAKEAGKWAIETECGKNAFAEYKTSKTYLDASFVGAQRGRWRVRAKVGNMLCPWSEWNYFRYTC